jgi:glutathione S-transferase
MLKLWGRKSAINVQKVLWLLAEIETPWTWVPAGGGHGRLGDAAFLALNPHGRIPVLQDRDLTIWESHTILRYLAARHGGQRFWSDDPARRAGQDMWMDWAQTSLQPAFVDGVFWGYFRTPPEQRDEPAIARALSHCDVLFRRLDGVLAKTPYLGGEQLGLADIPAGALLYRYFELDIPRPVLPHLKDWYGRLMDRAAYRASVAEPFEALRGRLSY